MILQRNKAKIIKNMRISYAFSYAIMITALLVFLPGCASAPEVNYNSPRRADVVEENIRDLLENDTLTEAYQEIEAAENLDIDISQEVLVSLRNKTVNTMQEELKKSINLENYPKAIRLFASLNNIEQNIEQNINIDNTDINLGLLHYRYGKKLESEGNIVSALIEFQRALDVGGLNQKQTTYVADLSIKNGNRPALLAALEYMRNKNWKPDSKYMDFVSDNIQPRNMLKGAVTIWVNRGIKVENGVGRPDRVIGSGFFIDKRGYLLTNYHVIQSEVDPEYEGYSRLYIKRPEDGEARIPARVVGYDPVFDIALLKVEIEPEYVFSLSDYRSFEPGESILALGSPGGLESTLTGGIISAIDRRFLQMGEAMQVDVPVNPGNSGGPLLTKDGKLVGVVFAGIEQFEGINFAIPAWIVRELVPRMYNGDKVTHPWMGVALKKTKKGLEVLYTVPNSPADKIGINEGDILISVNGREYSDVDEYQKDFLYLYPHTLISVSWNRNEKKHTSVLSLGERPASPVGYAVQHDTKNNLIKPLFGIEYQKTGSMLWETSYRVERIIPNMAADETGFSKNDPFSIRNFKLLEKEKIAVLQLHIKKRKSGFLENVVQMAVYLDVNYFL